jgi:hypothetical protein
VNLERLRRFLEIRKSTGAITVPQASAEGFDGKMGDWVTPKKSPNEKSDRLCTP